jgi:putative Mn2+ efflux pump MntP
MNIWEIYVIAVGLAMDAFAVSITLGLAKNNLKKVEYLIPGTYFGFFQFLMPVIGFYAGVTFADKIDKVDYLIAFVLLAFIGAKMIKDGFSEREDKKIDENTFKFGKMLILGIATSIDALAVGISFALFKVNILKAALIIGVITFLISTCGVMIGKRVGERFKSKATLIGGLILILIGTKILLEHLFFS